MPWKETNVMDQRTEFAFLVDRLNRAPVSIATNIAEGDGRFVHALRSRHDPAWKNWTGDSKRADSMIDVILVGAKTPTSLE